MALLSVTHLVRPGKSAPKELNISANEGITKIIKILKTVTATNNTNAIYIKKPLTLTHKARVCSLIDSNMRSKWGNTDNGLPPSLLMVTISFWSTP